MSAETVNCRSRLSGHCYHGRPSEEVYPDDGMSDDSTFDGETVVCDACYIALGQPTPGDPASIAGGRGRPGRRPGTPEGMTDYEWSVERFGLHGEDA